MIKYLHEGMPPTWQVPWGAWWRPILTWTLLGTLMAWSSLCICAMLRRQWVEQERLIFPLNYVPMAMTDPAHGQVPTALHPFFRDGLMWLGFAVPTILHAFNSLHCYVPQLPALNLRSIPIDQALTAMPWRAMRPLAIWIYPMGIGLSYLLSRDISFSLFFFYWLGKFELALGGLIGMSASRGGAFGGFPFLEEQCAGALLLLTASGLWLGRRQLLKLLRVGLSGLADNGEWKNGFSRPGWRRGACCWGWRHPVVVAWRGCRTLGQVRTSLSGSATPSDHAHAPRGGTVGAAFAARPDHNFIGPTDSRPGLTMISHLRWLEMDWRCLMMPNIMSSLKLAEQGAAAQDGAVDDDRGGGGPW